MTAPVGLPADLQLGAHRVTYRAARMHSARLVLIIITGIVTLPVFGIGLVFLYLAFRTPNLSKKQAAKNINLFQGGLVVADGSGPVSVYRWDAMTVLQEITRRYVNGVYVGTTYKYTLLGADGGTTKLTEFYSKPEEWGPLIQREVTVAQLPRVMETIGRGGTCRFGDLAINRDGLSIGERALGWPEIQEIDVASGYLRIKKTGKFLRSTQPVSKIPNFFVFLSAVHEVRG
ncbi:MAG TPA: DUF6585 family protein [Micromonosporaceae bacterium]|nr:DUF6585 family protein [Micromonosporaceae bacterium]